jgi:hypothetical protein
MAASAAPPQRPNTVDYGVILPDVCEYAAHLVSKHYNWFQQDNDFAFADAHKEFELVFSLLKTGRSLAASYNLQVDIQCTFRGEWCLFSH